MKIQNSMSRISASIVLFIFVSVCSCRASQIDHIQGEMAGEVTSDSVVLQSRLTAPDKDDAGDVLGVDGFAYFEISESNDFSVRTETEIISAVPEWDYIVKTKTESLKPGTKYYYRLVYGADESTMETGPVRSFKTLPDKNIEADISFVVVTGMHYDKFRKKYSGPDKHLGFPALKSIIELEPDFFVGTGDNVYYDHDPAATTQAQIRKKWHDQFSQPWFIDLFSSVHTYWEKDDHDYRYNDCDNTNIMFKSNDPSPALGRRTFYEQLPLGSLNGKPPLQYRKQRAGKLLEFWLLEVRDFRDPNKEPDGPDKTMLGKKQLEWLKRTLLESDATFKIIISPTPMVGPDDLKKKDNHVNHGGFRHEGDAIFKWLKDNDFLNKGLYIVCGDRHWQYHSIHPLGFEEFSSGALVDANSRIGVLPGDKKGTDPDARIKQPFVSPVASGGFLQVDLKKGTQDTPSSLSFNFFDEKRALLYSVKKHSIE